MDASQDRREFKFQLPAADGERFREFIAQKIPADRGAQEGYPVISEYFDTLDRHSYWQKVWGCRNRRRVRTRVYGRSDGLIPPAAFIEIKHKCDGLGVKRRAAVPLAALPRLSVGEIPEELLQAGRSNADRHLTEELRDLVLLNGARPVVQIRYDRMAYDSGGDSTIRVTFDTNLRCRFDIKPLKPGDCDFPLAVLDGEIVWIEIKTIGPVPVWMRDAAGMFQLHACSMSKYGRTLERFDPLISRQPHPQCGSHETPLTCMPPRIP